MSQTETKIDIDNLFAAIAQRRSMGLNRLREDDVPKEILQQAMEAANWAPSNGDTEPWRFTIYTGDARIALGEAFAEAYRQESEADGDFRPETYEANKERALSAPVWIAIGMEPGRRSDGSLAMSQEEEMMAVACAVQNMHLILSAHGLLGMWHSKTVSTHPVTAKFVGLEEPSKLLGLFWCGYPNIPWPAGERGSIEDRVRWA
jgi:nitroreductase